MTGPLALNRYSPQTWAAVASAAVWKRWALSPAGTVEAEALRGPLIIWAKMTPGEVGDSLRLEAPKPSPLDLRVSALNTAAHFERFRRAARGKVRASVRWKTGRKVRRAQVWEALDRVLCTAVSEERRAKGWGGVFWLRSASWSEAKRRREAEKAWKAERLDERLREIAPAYWGEAPGGFVCGQDDYYLTRLEISCHVAYQPEEEPEYFTLWKEGGAGDMLAYALLTRKGRAVRAIMRAIKRQARRSSLALTLTLRALEAAAYLAHVRRRAKPAPRRDRVPRPVYARPRPPSAPLAPPVTC